LRLNYANKQNTAYSQHDLERLSLATPLQIGDLKKLWLAALEEARSLINSLPADEVGCLYLNSTGTPVTPIPGSDAFSELTRHWGSVRGAWPTIGA
jgi:hypothetical protein